MEDEKYAEMFRSMLYIRMVEERIAELYPEQEMRCPVHLCIGQEAIAAGICATLIPEDYVLGGHRSHGHYLAKGGNLKAMMAEIYGRATGCSLGKGGSMHLVDHAVGFIGTAPIVASTIPIAVGTAFGAKMHGESRVTAVFFGEGATEEGVFHESINFAVLKELPVVFVCENNLYSVYSPLEVRHPNCRKVYETAKGHGIESFAADGNDVAEVYRLGAAAVDKARLGGGPTFLEFATYRWREHCGPFYDNDLGYRQESEYLEWKERCPIKRAECHMVENGIVDSAWIERLKGELGDIIEEAVAFAKSSPFPDAELTLEHIYSEGSDCGAIHGA